MLVVTTHFIICRMRTSLRSFAAALLFLPAALPAQQWLNAEPNSKVNKSSFRALDEWPSPNDFRDASGSPGTRYWQQRVDYVIRTTLDTATHSVKGSERITYHNNSPQPLGYLWFQLDQNIEAKTSRANMTKSALPATLSAQARQFLLNFGNDDVSITVPPDHIVRSTGTLRNPLQVLTHLHAERFVDQTPTQLFATLLDEDTYVCCPRTMSRVLAAHDEVRERRAQRSHPSHAVPRLTATAPNQV